MKSNMLLKAIAISVMLTLSLVMLCSCGDEEESASIGDALKLKYSVDTAIGYSSDNSESWEYGDLRKEFASDLPCYVRLDLTPLTNKMRGVDEEIHATIEFSGLENCDVKSTDGIVTPKKSGDANVSKYEVILMPQKEKHAEVATYIFKYEPKKACDMVMTILFDDKVDPKYDMKSTVYFVDDL